jgi:peptide/nickel transport system permease protein
VYDFTPSTSFHTLPVGKRSDRSQLVLGLVKFGLRELASTMLVLVGASLLLFIVLKAAPAEEHLQLRLKSDQAVETVTKNNTDSDAFLTSTVSEYTSWLFGVVQGEFGTSHSLQRGRKASELIWPAARTSFTLLLAGMLIAAFLALTIAIGVILRPYSVVFRVLSTIIGFFSAIPVFLYVYGLVHFGNRTIVWGAENAHWALPHWFPLPANPAIAPWLMAALILGVGDGGLIDLLQRFKSELYHASKGDHITGARLLGLSIPVEIARGFIPGALSHLARRVSFFLGSLVVLEAALGWPGIGYLAWRAAAERDMPVLLGSAFVMAVALKLVLMVFEFVSFIADPRRRRTR